MMPVKTEEEQKDWKALRETGPIPAEEAHVAKLFPNLPLVVEAVVADTKDFDGFIFTGVSQ